MGVLRWYLHKLRTSPIRANLASSLVLMTAGDVMAQGLEHHHLGGKFAGHDTPKDVPMARRLSLRRYGTHGHQQFDTDDDDVVGVTEEPQQSSLLALLRGDTTMGVPLTARNVLEQVQNEIAFIDPFRVATMVIWNVGFTTPAFLCLYHFCDRIFVKQTPWTVAGRVFLTLLFSVPVNTLFFTYGTCVHHTAEWYTLRDELRQEIQDLGLEEEMGTDVVDNSTPFDWDMMFSKVQLKIKTELAETIQKSASVWVPINCFNFAMVQPHLRPLTMMFFSVFWNCYLSIVQHRDVVLPINET